MSYDTQSTTDTSIDDDLTDAARTYHHLTGFQRDALVAIAEFRSEDGPVYGLAIRDRLEAYLDEDVNHGRLYPNLDDLVDQGLVAKSAIDKRTNRYELTERGETVLAAGTTRAGDALWGAE